MMLRTVDSLSALLTLILAHYEIVTDFYQFRAHPKSKEESYILMSLSIKLKSMTQRSFVFSWLQR